jgi:hypothetical protein
MANALDEGAREGGAGAAWGAIIGNVIVPGLGGVVGAEIGGVVGAVGGGISGGLEAAGRRPGVTIDPATGVGAELVNPEYRNPPGTPQQIAALRREIAILEDERAQTRRAGAVADRQATQARDLGERADQVRETTEQGGQRAGDTHQDADRREGANREAQGQQGQAHATVGTYTERAAGLSVLVSPLNTFRGFLHYASMLPGDIGAKFQQMEREAAAFQRALGQVGAQMAQTAAEGPAALAGWQAEQQKLVGARAQALGAQQTFQQQTQQADQISRQVAEARTQREGAATRADQHAERVSGQIGQREGRAETLASQLTAWAAEHRQARQDAVARTREFYEARGYQVSVRGA